MSYSSVLFIILLCSFGCSKQYEHNRLEHIINSLTKGLQYMKDHSHEINLDGVFGTRLVQEQLQVYLEYKFFENIRPRIEKLIDLSTKVSDEGAKYVKENEREYSSSVGKLMDRKNRILWFPSRETDPDEVEKPWPCSLSVFNENSSDVCLTNSFGSKNVEPCLVTDECVRMNRAPKQKGYVLTHQILYWQLLQMENCMTQPSISLQVHLCSNAMRDANEISRARYPLNHQDLFMEQIGLCGMWGFKDFYKFHWLDEMLKWQHPSGCFAHRSKWHCVDHLVPDIKLREKRREKILDNGCLSHKTAVALLAMTVSLRFEAERLYYSNL